MASVKITQIKSINGKPERQRRTIAALGLGKVNSNVTVEATAQIEGMIAKVNHLVTVER